MLQLPVGQKKTLLIKLFAPLEQAYDKIKWNTLISHSFKCKIIGTDEI